MPNPNPFLRPALDAMLRGARARRAAHPFLASENIGLRGADFPGPSAMPTMPRPSVLTREQEFQAGKQLLPERSPIGPAPIGFGPLELGQTHALSEGFTIRYNNLNTDFGQRAHVFDILGAKRDRWQVRVVESTREPGVGHASVSYYHPLSGPGSLGKLHPTPSTPPVPTSVIREVIREIRDAIPDVHTIEGGRTAGAHSEQAQRLLDTAGAEVPQPEFMNRVLDANLQRIRLRRPFLEQ